MLSTLTKAADIADRILLARFEQLESSPYPIPTETFEQSLDYLARLTAIRKALMHLEQGLTSPSPNPKPANSIDSPFESDAPDSVLAEPALALPRIPSVSDVRQPSLHEIAELPAMPLDRIEPTLVAIIAEIAHLSDSLQNNSPELGACERRSPERPNHPSPQDRSPELGACERRSPERPNHPSPQDHFPESVEGAIDEVPLNSS